MDSAWAATTYDGAGRRLITQLKFGRRTRLARLAAATIATGVPAEALRGTVVPVPADPLRRRLRGFDPAALIAIQLGRIAELPLSHCLARRHGPRQVGRRRAERVVARPRLRLIEAAPLEVVLVDDVVTTGTTLAACASALRADGCTNLLAVAFARA